MQRKPVQFLGRAVSGSVMRATIAPRIEKSVYARWKRFNEVWARDNFDIKRLPRLFLIQARARRNSRGTPRAPDRGIPTNAGNGGNLRKVSCFDELVMFGETTYHKREPLLQFAAKTWGDFPFNAGFSTGADPQANGSPVRVRGGTMPDRSRRAIHSRATVCR